jgi:hypothetical protein
MIRLDLHTHSTASPDGGISAAQYQHALESGLLDCVAVTDHNRIDLALQLHEQLGERIIVGEEIMSTEGEIIGLYMTKAIEQGLTPLETIRRIKVQGGLVYIPHPFETVRKGLHPAVLEEIADSIDIIEICNGRALLQNRSDQTVVWARLNHKLGAASSDAHGTKGLGKTYMTISALPARENLLQILQHGTPVTDRPGFRALLYPKYHRLRKKLGGEKS